MPKGYHLGMVTAISIDPDWQILVRSLSDLKLVQPPYTHGVYAYDLEGQSHLIGACLSEADAQRLAVMARVWQDVERRKRW